MCQPAALRQRQRNKTKEILATTKTHTNKQKMPAQKSKGLSACLWARIRLIVKLKEAERVYLEVICSFVATCANAPTHLLTLKARTASYRQKCRRRILHVALSARRSRRALLCWRKEPVRGRPVRACAWKPSPVCAALLLVVLDVVHLFGSGGCAGRNYIHPQNIFRPTVNLRSAQKLARSQGSQSSSSFGYGLKHPPQTCSLALVTAATSTEFVYLKN